MRKAALGAVVVLVAAGLTACATTTFSSSWKAPDAQPMGSLTGQKVVAVAVTKNQAMRRSAEDALVGVLNARGAQGIPSYSIIGDDAVQDEAKARAAIEKTGAVAVVVMRPVAQEKEVSATSSMYMGPRVRRLLGGVLRLRLGRRLWRRRRHPYRHDCHRRNAGLFPEAEQARVGRTEQDDEPVEDRRLREGSGGRRGQGNEAGWASLDVDGDTFHFALCSRTERCPRARRRYPPTPGRFGGSMTRFWMKNSIIRC